MSFHRTNQSVALRVLFFFGILFAVLNIAWGPLSAQARAQDSAEMSAVYGRGVHAYFSNRLAGAEQLFSQVVRSGSTDPRVYYFRAMTRLRTGRQQDAEEDMEIGAEYEARDPGNRHSIGIALQRVQGQGRRTLERFRREGRLSRVQRRRQQSRLRYEQLEQRGPQVLRREEPVQLEQLSEPSMQLTVPEASPATTGPPTADTSSETEAPVSGEVPDAGEDDLFFDSTSEPEESSDSPADPMPRPEASDSTGDFFDDPAPSEPTTSESVETEPTETNEDPFADAAEAEVAPESNTDLPMTDEKAAASEEEASEPTAADDLFGDDEAAEEMEERLEESPAESESGEELDDLFGDSETSETSDDSAGSDADSAEEDPFAEEPAEESEASEPEEAEPMEEPSEAAEADDLFGSASPKESSRVVPNLTENDQVESSKLFGIFGRLLGSAVPWKNIQMPTANLSPKAPDDSSADPLGGIALGPLPANQGKVAPASAEEEVVGEDFFGDAKPSSSSPPTTEGPFDNFGDDPFGAAKQNGESESSEATEEPSEAPMEEEDFFGDF